MRLAKVTVSDTSLHAVLLDLDDTLYDHHYASRKAIVETISLDDALFAAGADSVSLVTDVSLNPDPEARARQWVAATRDQA